MTTRLIITFEPRAEVDVVRAIRRLLKFAGRHLGLKAIDVQERVIITKAETATPPEETDHEQL